ncbi:SpoIIE family protein phosphatase [Streptomyces smaragdinus]|uniref:SpoIIE family protein phosphatase n=1 Tax=Streptomyces smaragdinus TaxID=2585196 RepID=UPI0012978E22|nr:SpoIIE family protein phosphatase [Streptomyces smaragdinus]
MDEPVDPLDRALLHTLFTRVPVGLYVLDGRLRLIRSNNRGPGLAATPPLEWSSPGLGGSPAVTSLLREVLNSGRPEWDVPLHDVAGFPGQVLSLSAVRVEDSGSPVGLAVAVRDTTVRHHALARLELLRAATRTIGTTLDVFRTAQELADAAVPGLASGAAVEILDSVVLGDAPAPGPVVEVSVRRAGFAWAGKALQEGVYPQGAVRVLGLGTPMAQALADVRPRLVREMRVDDPWLERDQVRARLLAAAGAHSLLVVPMSARGVVLGLAVFYRVREDAPFDDDDMEIALELVDRAALCVDNARRYTREHTLAGLLQRTFVPARLPVSSAARTAHTYLPVASGGTGYDVLRLSGGRVALVVGDVAGTGLASVAAMGRLRTAVAALSSLDIEPGELLARLHDLTVQLANEQAEHTEGTAQGVYEESAPLSATCLYAVYDPVSGECSLASAGHPPPVLVPPTGAPRVLTGGRGPKLGRGEARYEPAVYSVAPGSVLALYSEALAREPEEEGGDSVVPARIAAALESTGSLQEACDAAVSALLPDERPAADDVLLLLAQTRVLGPDQVASWTLPPAPQSASSARHLVTGQLMAWGLEELAPGMELVTSELVTNAVRYSRGRIGLRLIREETLICEVTDNSSASPHLRHAADDDEGGRGLFLVGQLSDHWGIRHSPAGKTVWAEQQLP